MTKETYRERERRKREDEIISTAETLLAERGYANLTMDELAEAVGISKPTLYQHFRGKEELAAQVFIRGFRQTERFLAEPLSGPAIERIVGLIRWTITQRYTAGNVVAGMRPDVLWTVMRAHPEAEELRSRVHSYLIGLIEKARAEGSITTEVPTPVLLHSVLSLQWALHSPLIQAEIENSPAGLDGVIDSLVCVFLHGVMPRIGAPGENKTNGIGIE